MLILRRLRLISEVRPTHRILFLPFSRLPPRKLKIVRSTSQRVPEGIKEASAHGYKAHERAEGEDDDEEVLAVVGF